MPSTLFEDIKGLEEETNLLYIKRIIKTPGNWETLELDLLRLHLVKGDKPCTPSEALKPLMTKYAKPEAGSPDVANPLTPEIINRILSSIASALKGKFKLISQIRDVKNPIVNRVTLIDSELQNALWNLDQSIKPEEEQKCSVIETAFEEITGKRIDPAQGQVYIRRMTQRFPLNLEGGGVQASIQLIYSLKSEAEKFVFFGIEEPEAHSHPELQRKLFEELKSFSSNRQVFVITHSPTFVDRSELSNVWISRFIETETSIKRADDLQSVISELGIRPSDVIFFANKIIFVEGKSDAIILQVFAKKLLIDLTDIAIVPVGGKNQARANLKTWIEIARGTLPVFLLLDNDAKQELRELENTGLISPSQRHLWKEGSIESYYPIRLLQNALTELNQRYNLEMDVPTIIQRIEEKKLCPDKIDIGQKTKMLDKSWEVLLAESMARLIEDCSDVELSEEVVRALRSAVS